MKLRTGAIIIYHEHEYQGQNLMPVKWVINEKTMDSNVITQARFVIRGFEEDG